MKLTLSKNLLLTGMAAMLLSAGTAQAANWQLVWADEFNGTIGPDWSFETGGGGWGNNEKQYYQPQNATVENGNLVITAKKESVGGYAYTSARMKTQGHKSWKYGKIVARIAMPSFQGQWPAFWMLGDNIGSVGWPACGELDIMEQINTVGTVHASTHWLNNGVQADWTSTANTSITAFHTYSMEWDPNYIRWFIDGNKFSEFYIGGNAGGTAAFNQNNFFILLNLAVGGNWPGSTVNDAALPGRMLVDYVRVYQDTQTPVRGNLPYFMVVNKFSGKCLDLISGNTANGARINQWTYDYNGANQRWAIIPTDNGDHFRFVSWVSGKTACIADDSMNDGAQLHDWDYTGNNPSQQFDLIDAGNGWFKIRNVRSGKILDDAGYSTANDGKIQQWTDGNTDNQKWRLQPWGDYFIRANSGRYICVANAGNANGSRIIQYDWQNNPWFKWRFSNKGDGWYGLFNLNALTKVLCVAGPSTTPGQYCHLWEYNASNIGDQKIRIMPQLNGTFKYYFQFDGQTWDIPGGQTGNNVPLNQYNDNGNAWQRFTMERVP